MSTKKKVGISDLLRDEVQKGIETPINVESTEQTIEVIAETINESSPKINKPLAVSSTEKIQSKVLIPDDGSKAKIVALEATIEQAQKKETELLQTIADLQKDLQFSHTNVELLQKSLAAIEQLKNELDQQLVEVKRDNLRLAEANIQLSEQVKVFESAKTSIIEAPNNSQLVSQSSQTLQNNRATPRKQPVEQPYPQRDRTPYVRPTGSNEQLQRINNKNIGWMD